jgi:hypothetical protein
MNDTRNDGTGGPARPERGGARPPGPRRAGLRRAGLRRAGLRRAGVLTAALAGTALLAAACGGGGPAGESTAYQTTYQKQLGYAQCMRAHGLPGFPDPQSNGTFNSTRANGSDFVGPRFQSADRACAHLEGPAETAAQFQRDVRGALRYAACMRAHGIAGFQATVQGNRIGMGIQGPGTEMNSPLFLSAQRACRKLVPVAGS